MRSDLSSNGLNASNRRSSSRVGGVGSTGAATILHSPNALVAPLTRDCFGGETLILFPTRAPIRTTADGKGEQGGWGGVRSRRHAYPVVRRDHREQIPAVARVYAANPHARSEPTSMSD